MLWGIAVANRFGTQLLCFRKYCYGLILNTCGFLPLSIVKVMLFPSALLSSAREAAAWLRRAADQGHGDAQVALGLYYLYGKGVRKSRAQAPADFTLPLRSLYESLESLRITFPEVE